MQPLATYFSDSYPEMSTMTWHLLVNRIVQGNKTSCSVASLTIAFNGLTSASNSGVVPKLLDEAKILSMLNSDSRLCSNLKEGTGGATLSEIADIATQVISGIENSKLTVSVHHMEESGQKQIENFKQDLADSFKGNSVIVANYHQGVATGRDLSHGHFAPISSLNVDAEKVCVVDPSMEGLPFILDVEQLCKAMATKDNSSGNNRGYLKIALN